MLQEASQHEGCVVEGVKIFDANVGKQLKYCQIA
jgi:hypothetical protein